MKQKTIEMRLHNDTVTESEMTTRQLFMQTLKQTGCQYEYATEDDNGHDRIYFAYQGERFFADIAGSGPFVTIWDACWGHVNVSNIEEFAMLKRAINYANLHCATMCVYTIDEDTLDVNVHCKTTFPLIAQMDNLPDYLHAELADFFRAHHLIGSEMIRQRREQAQLRRQDVAS